MPNPAPLPPYYLQQADCSRHTIFPGVDIFTAAGENLMISIVELQPNSVVEPHSHPHEQMGILLEGEFTFTIGGHTKKITPGEIWRIPSNVVHSVVNGPKFSKAIDVFCPVREDYR
jgi:quercetin dioxygenase-like cupin family protein